MLDKDNIERVVAMANFRYVYGPVPSRRLGVSLGISPIPPKTCNHSCVYCQLGRTSRLTNTRRLFFPVNAILDEVKQVLANDPEFDVVTIVGEGEPTLYLGLDELIAGLKKLSSKPVAIITNGSLLYDPILAKEVMLADIVLPSLDALDEATFKAWNRPHPSLHYEQVVKGIIDFSHQYTGQLWMEVMLMKDLNDSDEALEKLKSILNQIRYDKVYLNTPVRPPTEKNIEMVTPERMKRALEILGGISIEMLVSEGFESDIADDYTAIISIITRHPMNQHEIQGFLTTRGNKDTTSIFERLHKDRAVEVVEYLGYRTYRLK